MLQRSLWRPVRQQGARRCLQYALKFGRQPYPVIDKCPEPTCQCSPTPEGLDIKRDGPMTIPDYTAHVVIHTKKNDWTSRIEEDGRIETDPRFSGLLQPNLARSLKDMLGPRGSHHDVSLSLS